VTLGNVVACPALRALRENLEGYRFEGGCEFRSDRKSENRVGYRMTS